MMKAVVLQVFAFVTSALAREIDIPDIEKFPTSDPGKPLEIQVSVEIKDLRVNNPTGSKDAAFVTLETSTILYWNDIRNWWKLKNYETLADRNGNYSWQGSSFANEIWMPDIFIDRAFEIRNPEFMSDASSFKIYQNGLTVYSTVLNYDVEYDVDYTYFPFDKQICNVSYESFAHETNELYLTWREEPMRTKPLKVRGYDHKLEFLNIVYDMGDESYSRAVVKITLKRHIFYYIPSVFLPSCFLMFMAYCSTWLDPTMAGHESRINLTIVNVAILLTQINMVYGEVPRTTYLNMLDWWLLPILYYCSIMVLWFIPIQNKIEAGHPVYATYLEMIGRFIWSLFPFIYLVVYVLIGVVLRSN